MIAIPENIAAAQKVLQGFLINGASALPEASREQLIAASTESSPVVRLVNATEILYAAGSDLDKAGRDTAAALAGFVASHGFHGMEERGLQISAALQRIGGYAPPAGSSWPDASEDPEPLSRYAPAQEDTAPVAQTEEPAAEA